MPIPVGKTVSRPWQEWFGLVWYQLVPDQPIRFVKARFVFKRPPAGAAARRFFEIFEKIAFFEKLVKIGFLTLFGTIWA